ncbi:MAG TPA: prolyl oligopeptidase family serine peptidase [Ktedonosporobacter sp.]|nr:prolyl oligopeptidase family serine peptidase [Ktedonosporobacter sp.]
MAGTVPSSLALPPSAHPVVDEYHGVRIPDPYRWLEQLESPETRSWIEDQRTAVTAFFEHQPSYEAVRRRLTELWQFPKYSVPFKHGKWRFFWGQDLAIPGDFQQQPVLYRQEASGGEVQVVLDPSRQSMDGSAAITTYAVSPDGAFLAYALSRGGSDWQEIRILHLNSGVEEGHALYWCKFPAIAWTPDNAGFFYNCYPAPDEATDERKQHGSNHIRFHRPGTSQSADQPIFTPAASEVICTPIVTDDGAYVLIHVCKSAAPDDHIFYRPLGRNGSFFPLFHHIEAHYRFIGSRGSTCYLETDHHAPRGRVIAVDLASSERERWRMILPEQDDSIAFSTLADSHLLVGFLHHAWHRLILYALDGTFVRELALPSLGAINGIWARSSDPEVFLSWESFLCPPTIYHYDTQAEELTLLHPPQTSFDALCYETIQVFYPSKDGTHIPMFITRKKGLSYSGATPTLLYAYGGFGMSVTPSFWLSQLCWLEQGGIFAVANIRGGGEYGKEWHRAAVCERKQTSIDDLLSGASFLTEHGYTCPERLALMGMSNGGLLAAACLVQHPELFGAMVCQSPLADMLRYHRFTVGAHLVAEYGNAEADYEQFCALLAFSPLHNVRAGEAYPQTLITTAENDLRAVPAHAMKFAAALQAANAGPHPILLCIEPDGGHGVGRSARQRIDALSKILIFLLQALVTKQ